MPYQQELTRNFSQALWVLLGAVALLLLIACANLANLMLVRASDRRREMAIRQALGARRSRLARQLLIESALLALGGALLGILLARWAVPALVALSPASLPRAREIQINRAVLLFTLGATTLAALASGLVPALRAARVDPNADLKAEGRGSAGAMDRSRTRGLIVAGQVAVMMLLLTGTGLLVKSFREVMRVEPGFDSGVLTVRLSLPRKDYGEIEKLSQFYQAARNARRRPARREVRRSGEPRAAERSPREHRLQGRGSADRAGRPAPNGSLPHGDPGLFPDHGDPAGRGPRVRRRGPRRAARSWRSSARPSPDRASPAAIPVGEHLLVNDTPDGFPIDARSWAWSAT